MRGELKFMFVSLLRHLLVDSAECFDRYPTLANSGPAAVAARLKGSKGWTASGDLSFLNGWEYALGAEVLTPFGRGQLCESTSPLSATGLAPCDLICL